MPTSYSGDPTASETPSPAPGPGAVPITKIPIDGEALNASSISQALKTLADFSAWLALPDQAELQATASDWAVKLALWRNAQGIRRFSIDHQGLPVNDVQLVQENFLADAVSMSTTGEAALTGTWWRKSIQGGGSIVIQDPGDSATGKAEHRSVLMTPATSGSMVAMRRPALASYSPGVVFSLEWDALITDTCTDQIIMMGAGDPLTGSLIASPAEIISGFNTGAFFRKDVDDVHWQCHLGDGDSWHADGTTVDIDSDAWHRFRIEYHGTLVADVYGTARIVFLIDGAVVTNATSYLPDPADEIAACTYFGIENPEVVEAVPGLLIRAPISFGSSCSTDET
jgi:hypothetical protein